MTGEAHSRRRLSRKNTVGGLLSVAVVVIVFGFVLPRFADYGDVWHQVQTMSIYYAALLLAAEVVNLVTFAPPFMIAMPGMRVRQALELQYTGTAISYVVPLGGAVGMTVQYRMLREWGFTARASSRAMVVTAVWTNLVNLALPAIGLTWLTVGGEGGGGMILAAEVGTGLFIIMLGAFSMILWSDLGARVVALVAEGIGNAFRRLVRRPPRRTLVDTMIRFRADSTDLLKRKWLAVTVSNLVNVITMFGVLYVGLRSVGLTHGEISMAEAFAAWSLTRLLVAVPISPGGLGIIDVALTGALTGFGGPEAKVVAAVLLYRVATFVPPLVLGAAAMFTWRRHPEHHQPPPVM